MQSNSPRQPDPAPIALPDDAVPLAQIAPASASELPITDFDSTPKYRNLITMSRALTIFGFVGYLTAIAILCVGGYQTIIKNYYHIDDMLGYLFFSLFVTAVAVFLHAIGACLKPFRDLVRNSFKNR